MPLGDDASAAGGGGVGGWWSGLSMAMKGLVVLGTVVVLTGAGLGIAAAAGAFNSEESDITLRVLTYACTDTAQSPDYSKVLAAKGSSYHTVPTWEGTLYTKVSAGTCVKTYSTYSAAWPPVTSNSSAVPSLPDGASGMKLDMWEDEATGNYHLRADDCVLYYYAGNTADSYFGGVGAAWPVLKADGTTATAAPVCS